MNPQPPPPTDPAEIIAHYRSRAAALTTPHKKVRKKVVYPPWRSKADLLLLSDESLLTSTIAKRAGRSLRDVQRARKKLRANYTDQQRHIQMLYDGRMMPKDRC